MARIAVDLDGTIAAYDGFKGMTKIGAIIDGAREFLDALNELGTVVVFTARLDGLSPKNEAIVKQAILDWIKENNLPIKEVYSKLNFQVFIDDRGVGCRPQEDEDAYKDAIERTKRILKK